MFTLDYQANPAEFARVVASIIMRVPLLTDREQEVLAILAEGTTNLMIAHRLGVTERTVKAHITQIFLKLKIQSRVQAAVVSHVWQHGCLKCDVTKVQ